MAKKAKAKAASKKSPPRSKGRGGTASKPKAPSWEGKRVKDLTEAEKYARRIARAQAQGKTRQQARGHKEKGEHRRREERERIKYGIAKREYDIAYRFALKRAHKDPGNDDPDAFAREYAERIGQLGYQAHKEIAAEQQRLQKIKRERVRRTVRRSGFRFREEVRVSSKRGHMENFTAQFGVDWKVLFYH